MPGSQNSVSGNAVVLVADDEPIVLLTVESILSNAGYTVLAARDGAEALRISRTHPGPIDLLLTDVLMRNLTGLELSKVVAVERPGIRTLLMTGQDLRNVPKEMLPILLPKPFRSRELLTRIQQALAWSAAHRE